MSRIVPLKGFLTAKAVGELQSIDSEMSEFKGMKFITVDAHAKRNEVKNNKTRIRLFEVKEVYEGADEYIAAYVGKKMYCICMEDENANNVVIEKDTGDKLFILPVTDVLAELRENHNN